MRLGLLAIAWLALGASSAQAQPRVCPLCTVVGDAPDGMPGLHQIPFPVLRPPVSGAVALLGGYGVSLGDPWADGSRHRATGSAHAVIHPTEWLAIGAGGELRYDVSTRGGVEESALWGHPSIDVRTTVEPTRGLGLALDVSVWMRGTDGSLDPASTSVRARVSGSYQLYIDDAVLGFSAALGPLVDNSRFIAPDGYSTTWSDQDRLALGISGFSAVFFGFGALFRYQWIEAIAELNYRILVGDQAPTSRSPGHIVLGARARPYSEWVELGLYLDFRVNSSDPDLLQVPASLTAPIDPLFTLSAQVTVRFGNETDPSRTYVLDRPVEEVEEDDEPVDPLAGRRIDESGDIGAIDLEGNEGGSSSGDGQEGGGQGGEGGQAGVPSGEIRGVVQSFNGAPLEGAVVQIEPGAVELRADADGAFEVRIAPGRYDVTVTAEGHRPQTRRVTVEEDAVVVLNAQLQRAR